MLGPNDHSNSTRIKAHPMEQQRRIPPFVSHWYVPSCLSGLHVTFTYRAHAGISNGQAGSTIGKACDEKYSVHATHSGTQIHRIAIGLDSPAFQQHLKQLKLRLHPDRVAAHPCARAANEQSFKVLSQYLEELRGAIR